MLISPSPFASPAGHCSSSATPKAIFTICTSSSIVTSPSRPQSPTQVKTSAVGVGLRVGVSVGTGVIVGVGEWVRVDVGVGVLLVVTVGVADGVAVTVELAVGVPEGVDDAVGVEVGVGVSVAVGVTVAVEVWELVGVTVTVTVGVWVCVRVTVTEGVGVAVVEAEGVAVCVGVEVIVGVRVGVLVSVGVGVIVGVGVGAPGQTAQPTCGLQATFPEQNSAGGQLSKRHPELQPSQLSSFPSSHSSGNSIARLPHVGHGSRQSAVGANVVQSGKGLSVGEGRTEFGAKFGCVEAG